MNKVLIYSINTQKKINGDLIIYSLQNLFNIIPKIHQNKVTEGLRGMVYIISRIRLGKTINDRQQENFAEGFVLYAVR